MVWASRAPSRRRRPTRPSAGWTRALTWSAVVGGLIGAAQWAVLGDAAPAATGAWSALVLAVPAFLAGTTLVRLALVLPAAWRQHRRHREIRRQRGEHQ